MTVDTNIDSRELQAGGEDDGFDFVEISKRESLDEEEEYEFPLAAAMAIAITLAVVTVIAVFYCSYKHEQVKRQKEQSRRETPRDGYVSDDDMEQGLPTKKWKNEHGDDDYEVKMAEDGGAKESRFCGLKSEGCDGITEAEDSFSNSKRDCNASNTEESSSSQFSLTASACKTPEELQKQLQRRGGNDDKKVSSSNRSRSNSGHSVEHLRELNLREADMRWQELLSQPRCVLCSKNFGAGDDVTHSNNPQCNHEYHIECLTSYWAKSKTDNCPVCKKKYIVEEHTA